MDNAMNSQTIDAPGLNPILPPEQEAVRQRAFHPSGEWTPLDTIADAQSLLDYFAQQVVERPDHPAIQRGDRCVTYADLDQQSSHLARAIRARVGDEAQAVGLLLADATLTIMAVVAVWKAGKFFIVLDEQEPLERLAYLSTDAQAACLLTDQATEMVASTVATRLTPTIPVVVMEDALMATTPEMAPLPISATMLARLSYSSGSTGQPKGIPHTHGHLLNDSAAANPFFHIGPQDRFLYFMVGFELFASIATGATMVPFSLRHAALRDLADAIHEEAVTTVRFKPTVFRQLMNVLHEGEQFSAMRLVHYRRDVELHRKHFGPDSIMVVTLGSQEALNYRQQLVGRESALETDRVPVGYLMAGRRVRLVGDDGQPVAPGEIGEIAVTSHYLSPGYWRREELSAVKFWADPQDGGARTYLTGDLGYYDAAGRFFHAGRKDFRLKIRGYTIEPAEIEVALLNTGLVKDAVVMAFSAPSQADAPDAAIADMRLVAHIVPAVTPSPTVTDLRQQLRRSLPEYMVPSYFILLDTLPMLPGGKVNRKALPPPDQRRPELNTLYVAARDDYEAQLVTLWEETLEVTGIGIQDNFFDLGGHSIALMRLLTQIKRAFGRTIDAVTFLQAQTIEQVASALRSLEDAGSTTEMAAQPNGSTDLAFVKRYLSGQMATLGEPTLQQKLLDSSLPHGFRMWLFRMLCHNRAVQQSLFRKESSNIKRFVVAIHGEHNPQMVANATALYLVRQLAHRYSRGVLARTVQQSFPRWVAVTGQDEVEIARHQGQGVILVDIHRLIPPSVLPAIFQQLDYEVMQFLGEEALRSNPTLVRALKAYFGDENEISVTAKFIGAQFDAARQILETGGIVRIAADGGSGGGGTLTHMVFGRRCGFKTGFAELALETGAAVIPMSVALEAQGNVQLTFYSPLDVGLPTSTHDARMRALVEQYVGFLTTSWQADPSCVVPAYVKHYFTHPMAQPIQEFSAGVATPT